MNGITMQPSEIEQQSFAIITRELGERTFEPQHAQIIKRVIHTTADFEYADNLYFSSDAVTSAHTALQKGVTIVTDTNMAMSGINKGILSKLGGQVRCFIGEAEIAQEAKVRGITRAIVSMEYAAKIHGPLIFAIGNAPTALIRLYELIQEGICKPALVIGVPVGFVNVVESKELYLDSEIPCIIARGRKGGSNVAAAIVNALQYQLVEREGFINEKSTGSH